MIDYKNLEKETYSTRIIDISKTLGYDTMKAMKSYGDLLMNKHKDNLGLNKELVKEVFEEMQKKMLLQYISENK